MKYALIQKIQNLMKQLKEETYHEQGKYNRLGILQDDYDDDASMMVMNPSRKYVKTINSYKKINVFYNLCNINKPLICFVLVMPRYQNHRLLILALHEFLLILIWILFRYCSYPCGAFQNSGSSFFGLKLMIPRFH